MKLLVCGDRAWADRQKMDEVLDPLVGWIDVLIEGCARGADAMAEAWAIEHGVEIDHNPADWKMVGRAAGPMRNLAMLAKAPDLVIAFHANIAESKGTAHMIKIACKGGVPVTLIT